MNWLWQVEYIKTRNEELNRQCAELYREVENSGFRACVLKGQAVGSLYVTTGSAQVQSLAAYRQSGDIDLWMVDGPWAVIEWARKTGRLYYYDYHHADITWDGGAKVEPHYRPSISRNLLRNRRLQKWFKEEGKRHITYKSDLGFATLDYTFNVILTLNHNFWHLLFEGVGMRQMMDLYFILKSRKEEDPDILKLLKHFDLLRFAEACMWMMQHVFGLEDQYLICTSNEKAGRFLLDEIMRAGNFGHYDDRLRQNRYAASRIGLMLIWIVHASRLITQYPIDVLWTPVGVLRISIWRRFQYRNAKELKNNQ